MILHLGVYFSPKGGCLEAVVAEINKARREILVQAYSFTAKQISDALVEAKKPAAFMSASCSTRVTKWNATPI